LEDKGEGEAAEEIDSLKILNEDKLRIFCPEDSSVCNDNLFILYPQISHKGYIIRISVEIPDSLVGLGDSFVFWATTSNPAFTTFLLALRYTLVSLSIVSLLIYAVCFFRSPAHIRTFEHRFILLLSATLVLFNDPLYAVTILKSNQLSAILSTVFVTSFVCLLVFFWMIMVRRIHIEPSSVHTSLIKVYSVSLGALFFAIITVPGIIASIYTRFNPSLHFSAE
jgi:hypothetical protein